MQKKPNGWPAATPIEDIPDLVVTSDAPWAPEGLASVSSWQIRRDLTGGGLPGAARGGAGFSVAEGHLSVPQAVDAPLNPWASAPRQVLPGGAAAVSAEHGQAALPLGDFLVLEIEGADSSGALDITLIESQRSLDGPCDYQWSYDAEKPSMDAAEVIRTIASKAGYDTSLIENSGSRIRGVFDVSGKSNREVIQEIAHATMGAAWQDETGRLVYRPAERMRTGKANEIVLADESLEDVPWRISRDDTADRVELTYSPVSVVVDKTASVTLWEATDPIRVAANDVLTLTVTITGSTDRIAPWLPIWDTETADPVGNRMSRWGAAYNYNGDGERPPSSAVRVSAKIVGPSTVKITFTNRLDVPLWLVDGNGNPCLILRTTHHVTPGEQVTISAGARESQASNIFEFNCGAWVQDAAVAQNMLDWLWSQLSAPLGVLPQVNVKPDLARQIGDIIAITEEQITPDHVPLKSKALITGIDMQGDSNGYSQSLTLALLAVTFADFDTWAINQGIRTFQDLDSLFVDAGITTFEQVESWATKTLPEI